MKNAMIFGSLLNGRGRRAVSDLATGIALLLVLHVSRYAFQRWIAGSYPQYSLELAGMQPYVRLICFLLIGSVYFHRIFRFRPAALLALLAAGYGLYLAEQTLNAQQFHLLLIGLLLLPIWKFFAKPALTLAKIMIRKLLLPV